MRISELLIKWYGKNSRNLPWRQTQDPYPIWLSEIMLQQTRVEQALPYFKSFLSHFPTIEDLASATEEDVLRLWQGLGYYSRARNMHHTAQEIGFQMKGEFPSNYQDIRNLKGVGDYTAAAIASFAFKLPHPVIDGNVYRVISRLFCIEDPIDKPIGKRKIREAVDSIFDTKKPDIFNQAIMELGSLVCKPKNPNCDVCPLQNSCMGHAQNMTSALPKKSSKTSVKEIYHTYLIFEYKNATYIQKRTEGIWKNLYQFPLLESDHKPKDELPNTGKILKAQKLEFMSKYEATHLLSHRKIYANFYTFKLSQKPKFLKNDIFEIGIDELANKYPTSALTSKYLTHRISND